MSISFGTMPQRSGNWAWFKPFITGKSLKPQYEESTEAYFIYGYDIPEVLTCTIWKGVVPESVINGGYSQATNDADKDNFETNFKPYANRSIDDIPSLLIANSIKSGGSANLAVDGSVTPVVFEYNPPNNYDIEINALSFLFEDATAFQFGNKFVLLGIGTLANGLLLDLKAGDLVVSPWQNMKRTRDLIEICEDFDVITGTTNFMRIKVHMPRSLRLARAGTFAAADYLRVTVRDNLTSLDFAEAHFQGVKL
jgi:hypothetical protein